MASSIHPSNLQVQVSCGSALCDTEEGRKFLQQRTALFGTVCFLLCVGNFIFLNLIATVFDSREWMMWLTSTTNLVHLGAIAAFLVIAVLCRVFTLTAKQLAIVDATSMLVISGLVCLSYFLWGLHWGADHYGFIAMSVTLFLRAATIPSSAAQTLITGVVSFVPVLIGYHAASSADPHALEHSTPIVSTLLMVGWCLLVLGASTFASHVIFGLRQEAHEARQLGQFTIEERIGRGGMGEVYRASHALLRRPTAIKVLRPDHGGPDALARFEREVQLTSQLTHPNTIAIYDFGHTPEGMFYYAMEYLDGANLEEIVQATGPLPPERVVHILMQACGSLAEAHDTGFIHRDIKPANLFLCERGGAHDVVKVLDFGLVKEVTGDASADATSIDTIKGSPAYMSPESLKTPEDVDARTDIYSLGVVAYYLLTGRHVFEGANLMEVAAHHLHTAPRRPSELNSTVPSDLDELVLACLAKEAGDRPQSAAELRRRLEACSVTGSWSEAEAAAWWQAHANELRDAAKPTAGSDDAPLPQVLIPTQTIEAPTPNPRAAGTAG